MLLLISAEFVPDGNNMKVDLEGGGTVHFWDFFDKHISELIVKVQLCQTVFALPHLSDYLVHPEGYKYEILSLCFISLYCYWCAVPV